MNYFTPTQQRIALVETAQYNQKLLALRARRLAQQRMDYSHRIARHQQEDEMTQSQHEQDQDDDGIKTIYLGPAVQLTAHSDDESYEMDEIFAPVPYQKGYWLAAQRAQQKKLNAQAKAQQIQQLQQHQIQQQRSLAAQSAAVNKQANDYINKNKQSMKAMPALDSKPSTIQRSVSSQRTQSQYQYPYGKPRPHSYTYKPATQYQSQRKTLNIDCFTASIIEQEVPT